MSIIANKAKTFALRDYKDDVAIVMHILELNKDRTIRLKYSVPKKDGKSANMPIGEVLYARQATRKKIQRLLANKELGVPQARKGWIDAGPLQSGFYKVPKKAPRNLAAKVKKVVRAVSSDETALEALDRAHRELPELNTAIFAELSDLRELEGRLVDTIHNNILMLRAEIAGMTRSSVSAGSQPAQPEAPNTLKMTTTNLQSACFVALTSARRSNMTYFVVSVDGPLGNTAYEVRRGMGFGFPEARRLVFEPKGTTCLITGGLIND